MANNTGAFFDIDKTLVRVNTGRLFVRRRLQSKEGSWGEFLRVSLWITQYHFGFADAKVLTQKILQNLAGIEEKAFRNFCATLYEEDIRPYVTTVARDEVAKRQDQGAICAILSATTPYVSEPLAEDLGIDHVLCTHLQVEDGRFTGHIEPPLCFAEGKVTAAEVFARHRGIDLGKSSFYSDSVTDMPMFERVGEPRVVNPDPRLKRRAKSKGWPIETWR